MSHPPFIILDDSLSLPIYRQIYETFRRLILSGEFFAGKPLPASRALALQLGISRMTVINAYDQLTAEGYIESKPGAGTFVAQHLPEEYLSAPRLIQKPNSDYETPTPRQLTFSGYGTHIQKRSRSILSFHQPTPIVPFQHGLAAIDEFPFDIWTKAANKASRALPRNSFAYGDPAGFYPLREAVAAHLKSVRAVNCAPEQVIITGGAQTAFDLIGRIFLDTQSEVLVENPCYFGIKQTVQSFGAKLIVVPVDGEGLDLAATETQCQNAQLVYVTPSHQFPLGVTMSLARRLKLLKWAKKNGAWIIEDDYDSEFRYEGRPLPSLQGLDGNENNRVLYVGTFSKTIFPALRLGCVVVPPDLIEVFTAARAVSGAQSPLADQATLAEFIGEGHFGRHLRRMRRLYQERQAILIAELEKHLAGVLEVKKIVSGMHVISWLSDEFDDKAVAAEAARGGVVATPVSSLYLTEPECGGLILGYTAIGEKEIKKGVKKLVKVFDSFGKSPE